MNNIHEQLQETREALEQMKATLWNIGALTDDDHSLFNAMDRLLTEKRFNRNVINAEEQHMVID